MKYNYFFDWHCKLAHCLSAHDQLWVSLHQPNASYVDLIKKMPIQISSNDHPQVATTKIDKWATYIWWPKMNTKVAKKKTQVLIAKTTKVWKWAPKQ